MALPLYLAMTAAEFSAARPLPAHPAWMACHFSPYGLGLINFPGRLPESAMLVVNDRTPIHGHDPDVIAGQLREAAERLRPRAILLDFQRPGEAAARSAVEAVLAAAPCPVGVSAAYAKALSCPVLLPPTPLLCPLENQLAPWRGREIWLEVSLAGESVFVGTEGAAAYPWPDAEDIQPVFWEETLRCRYAVRRTSQGIWFHLRRSREDIAALLVAGEKMGVTLAAGLFQEFRGNQ